LCSRLGISGIWLFCRPDIFAVDTVKALKELVLMFHEKVKTANATDKNNNSNMAEGIYTRRENSMID